MLYLSEKVTKLFSLIINLVILLLYYGIFKIDVIKNSIATNIPLYEQNNCKMGLKFFNSQFPIQFLDTKAVRTSNNILITDWCTQNVHLNVFKLFVYHKSNFNF